MLYGTGYYEQTAFRQTLSFTGSGFDGSYRVADSFSLVSWQVRTSQLLSSCKLDYSTNFNAYKALVYYSPLH
jgi:hypothetical protein